MKLVKKYALGYARRTHSALLFESDKISASQTCSCLLKSSRSLSQSTTLYSGRKDSGYSNKFLSSAGYRSRDYASKFGYGNRSKFTWSASVEKYVSSLVRKHEKMTLQLLEPEELTASEMSKLSKEHQELTRVVQGYQKVLESKKELLELAALAIEEGELKDMAEAESQECKHKMMDAQQDLLELIVPADKDDDSSVILEVRAGTGGKEAALFTSDIFSLYQRYANFKGWKFDIIGVSTGETGGVKEASAVISGNYVFRHMKYEIGVHRVQRVPATESMGRIHTSTMTVAILPQPKEVESKVSMKDIKVETYKASGAGGQHVNTTDSAVRITHIPTGIVVAVQEERSQLKNRAKALRYLEAKLYDAEQTKLDKERREARRLQIGTGDRSERIRTYNFLQDRITDHRVSLTVFGVQQLLEGSVMFNEFLDELRSADQILSLGKITEMSVVD